MRATLSGPSMFIISTKASGKCAVSNLTNCPDVTSAMTLCRASRRIGLVWKRSMPAATALSRNSSRPCAVKPTIWVCLLGPSPRRRCCVASIPSITGMLMSIKMTSKALVLETSRQSLPFTASDTSCPIAISISPRTLRLMLLSSTIRMVQGVTAVSGLVGSVRTGSVWVRFSGKVNTNTDPVPSPRFNDTSPSMARAIRREIERPSPSPRTCRPSLRARAKKSSKICSCWSAGIPMPVSATSNRTDDVSGP
mmetsp:Transcript_397/g.1146  ORF Transcript_397/g.1146 Transcript_397/m.1146 type:complete len:252 (+) Transcript_397:1026-1781(+)